MNFFDFIRLLFAPDKKKILNAVALKSGLQRVDNSEKGGIIKEGNKKPITQITDNAIKRVPKIKIQGYNNGQCGFIQQQHKELLEYSQKNNGHKEVAFVFNGDLAK